MYNNKQKNTLIQLCKATPQLDMDQPVLWFTSWFYCLASIVCAVLSLLLF